MRSGARRPWGLLIVRQERQHVVDRSEARQRRVGLRQKRGSEHCLAIIVDLALHSAMQSSDREPKVLKRSPKGLRRIQQVPERGVSTMMIDVAPFGQPKSSLEVEAVSHTYATPVFDQAQPDRYQQNLSAAGCKLQPLKDCSSVWESIIGHHSP